jgi:cell division protein FtsB
MSVKYNLITKQKMNEEINASEIPEQKQNDSKKIIWIVILAVLVIAVVGFFLWQISVSSRAALEKQVADLQAQVDDMKKENEKNTAQVEIPSQPNQINQANQANQIESPQVEIEGWKKYTNEELGISFSYPKEWGEVKREKFDAINKSEVFAFSNVKASVLGGHHDDYWKNHPGRGPSLVDSDGFRLVEGKILGKKTNEDFAKYCDCDYSASDSGFCVYTTNLLWFGTTEKDGLAYHAVCNLNNKKISGFNFAFGGNVDPVGVKKDDFIKVIETVVVK